MVGRTVTVTQEYCLQIQSNCLTNTYLLIVNYLYEQSYLNSNILDPDNVVYQDLCQDMLIGPRGIWLLKI